MQDLLSKDRITAGPGFNRWLIPPAALAIHLCIGQAYAFSVFKGPLNTMLGKAAGVIDPVSKLPAELKGQDWTQPELGWIFTIAIVFLGLSAAVAGWWLEKAGPRKSGFVSACCWSLGFVVSAVGVWVHQLWLIYLGYGVLGGCGLGLGYITPVSTLIRWFPDRRGLATGMAIMGFGGGAMIASPLSTMLMKAFATPTTTGVPETFLVLGGAYFVFMTAGAFLFRLPPPGWAPAGWAPPAHSAMAPTTQYVLPNVAVTTPSFYLLWAVLFLNVTAGIGILEQASPMIQEVFAPRVSKEAAAGFVGLLSLFNLVGRFGWSSASDRMGRKPTYAAFFVLGAVLFAALPFSWRAGSVPLFVACTAVILSMYGGGFAAIPAYLSDIFGTRYVGAIHGRLLTAWSAAGVAGPVLVNYIRQYQIDHHVPKAAAYDVTMYLMAALLVIGFGCNMLVRRVPERLFRERPEVRAVPEPSRA
jgi:MFS family permease